MKRIKRYILLPLILLAAVLPLAGCFGYGGFGGLGSQAQATMPPQKEYKSLEEFKQAVADAKANETAADDVNLKGISFYYDLKALPEGAKLSSIKVSDQAIRMGYTFGETSADTYDNQIEIAWYRQATADKFFSQFSQSGTQYDTISINGTDYIHITAEANIAVTNAPGDTALATPTPRKEKYCQVLYWAQDDVVFMSAVPLGFTNDDMGKYCSGVKVELK